MLQSHDICTDTYLGQPMNFLANPHIYYRLKVTFLFKKYILILIFFPIFLLKKVKRDQNIIFGQACLYIYTHTHTYSHIYIYIYICVCVCVKDDIAYKIKKC